MMENRNDPILMGIDGGTGGIRVGLYDKKGSCLCFVSEEYKTDFPKPGWAQQDPCDWWKTLKTAIGKVLEKADIVPEKISALACDTTCTSVVVCLKDGTPLKKWTPIAPAKDLYYNKGQFYDLRCTYSNTIHFDGYYNGQFHTIYGLYINKDSVDIEKSANEKYIGLFSVDYSEASSYKNINIKDSFIRGAYGVGGIIGYSVATIEHCTVDAFIEGDGNHDYDSVYIGGITGHAENITNCVNYGSIHGSGHVGGITGYARSISNCTNRGSVSGRYEAGGIAGKAKMIRVSYNVGSVSGYHNVGGIAGITDNITQCYNAGNISGVLNTSDKIGGIAGSAFVNESYNTGSVTGRGIDPICVSRLTDSYSFNATSYSMNCYYLGEDSLYSDKITSSATALKAEQMTKEYCYKNWDFENIWTMSAEGYPQFLKDAVASLREKEADKPDAENEYKIVCGAVRVWDGETTEAFARGSGTEADPFRIENAKQLAYLAKTVNAGERYARKHFRLECDIVLNNTETDNKMINNWSAYASEWVPIGDDNNCFSGIFDGKGEDGKIHYISGLKVTSDNDSCGLFGYILNGTVKNLNVFESYVCGWNHVGGIC